MADNNNFSNQSGLDNSLLKKRYGFAIMHFKNGVYQGSVYKNKCHGKGVFMWDSGEFYFGEWENNQINGEGIFFFPQGGYIKGLFFKHKTNGASFIKFPNNDIYECFWRHGKLDGKCFKYFSENNIWALCEYEKGYYQKCLKTGQGKNLINFEDKIITNIENQNSDKLFNKFGMIDFYNGNKFYGYIDNNIPNGYGILIYAEGRIEMGCYNSGTLNGISRIYYPNGNIYYGNLIDGYIHDKVNLTDFDLIGFYYDKSSNAWIHAIFDKSNILQIYNKNHGYPHQELSDFLENIHINHNNYIQYYMNSELFYIPIIIADHALIKNNIPQYKFLELKSSSYLEHTYHHNNKNQHLINNQDISIGIKRSENEDYEHKREYGYGQDNGLSCHQSINHHHEPIYTKNKTGCKSLSISSIHINSNENHSMNCHHEMSINNSQKNDNIVLNEKETANINNIHKNFLCKNQKPKSCNHIFEKENYEKPKNKSRKINGRSNTTIDNRQENYKNQFNIQPNKNSQYFLYAPQKITKIVNSRDNSDKLSKLSSNNPKKCYSLSQNILNSSNHSLKRYRTPLADTDLNSINFENSSNINKANQYSNNDNHSLLNEKKPISKQNISKKIKNLFSDFEITKNNQANISSCIIDNQYDMENIGRSKSEDFDHQSSHKVFQSILYPNESNDFDCEYDSQDHGKILAHHCEDNKFTEFKHDSMQMSSGYHESSTNDMSNISDPNSLISIHPTLSACKSKNIPYKHKFISRKQQQQKHIPHTKKLNTESLIDNPINIKADTSNLLTSNNKIGDIKDYDHDPPHVSIKKNSKPINIDPNIINEPIPKEFNEKKEESKKGMIKKFIHSFQEKLSGETKVDAIKLDNQKKIIMDNDSNIKLQKNDDVLVDSFKINHSKTDGITSIDVPQFTVSDSCSLDPNLLRYPPNKTKSLSNIFRKMSSSINNHNSSLSKPSHSRYDLDSGLMITNYNLKEMNSKDPFKNINNNISEELNLSITNERRNQYSNHKIKKNELIEIFENSLENSNSVKEVLLNKGNDTPIKAAEIAKKLGKISMILKSNQLNQLDKGSSLDNYFTKSGRNPSKSIKDRINLVIDNNANEYDTKLNINQQKNLIYTDNINEINEDDPIKYRNHDEHLSPPKKNKARKTGYAHSNITNHHYGVNLKNDDLKVHDHESTMDIKNCIFKKNNVCIENTDNKVPIDKNDPTYKHHSSDSNKKEDKSANIKDGNLNIQNNDIIDNFQVKSTSKFQQIIDSRCHKGEDYNEDIQNHHHKKKLAVVFDEFSTKLDGAFGTQNLNQYLTKNSNEFTNIDLAPNACTTPSFINESLYPEQKNSHNSVRLSIEHTFADILKKARKSISIANGNIKANIESTKPKVSTSNLKSISSEIPISPRLNISSKNSEDEIGCLLKKANLICKTQKDEWINFETAYQSKQNSSDSSERDVVVLTNRLQDENKGYSALSFRSKTNETNANHNQLINFGKLWVERSQQSVVIEKSTLKNHTKLKHEPKALRKLIKRKVIKSLPTEILSDKNMLPNQSISHQHTNKLNSISSSSSNTIIYNQEDISQISYIHKAIHSCNIQNKNITMENEPSFTHNEMRKKDNTVNSSIKIGLAEDIIKNNDFDNQHQSNTEELHKYTKDLYAKPKSIKNNNPNKLPSSYMLSCQSNIRKSYTKNFQPTKPLSRSLSSWDNRELLLNREIHYSRNRRSSDNIKLIKKNDLSLEVCNSDVEHDIINNSCSLQRDLKYWSPQKLTSYHDHIIVGQNSQSLASFTKEFSLFPMRKFSTSFLRTRNKTIMLGNNFQKAADPNEITSLKPGIYIANSNSKKTIHSCTIATHVINSKDLRFHDVSNKTKSEEKIISNGVFTNTQATKELEMKMKMAPNFQIQGKFSSKTIILSINFFSQQNFKIYIQ